MSVIIDGGDNLYAYSNSIRQNYYMSNYYALQNQEVFIQYKNPINSNLNQSFYLSGYLTDFGDATDYVFSNPDDLVFHTYTSNGTYFVSYTAVYVESFVQDAQINKISKSIDDINRIILNVNDTPQTLPAGLLDDPSYSIAQQNILSNKEKLQLQVVEYAKTTFPTAMNDSPSLSAKCYRDMGYIIDAIAADIGNNANHRSVEVGSMYFQTALLAGNAPFTGSPVPNLPLSEVQATIDCIKILENYINGIDIPLNPPPFTETGILSSIETGSARQSDVSDRIANIIFPLENDGDLNPYFPTNNPSISDLATADTLLSKKTEMQSAVSQFVIEQKYLPSSNYIQKCNRDIGLIIDAIAADLKNGVTAKCIQYGLVYWEGNISRLRESITQNHKQKTTDAISYLLQVIDQTLRESGNDPKSYQYVTDIPFNIKTKWETYDPSNIRLNDEIVLQLPYTLDEIEIQPNEWGVEDIFNTSITRLQECLEYLISKTQTLNTSSPTVFFGWLGNSSGTPASFLKWFTKSYNPIYLNNSILSKSTGESYFTNVYDVANTKSTASEFLVVLDNKKIRLFYNNATPTEFFITNGDVFDSFLIEPDSLAVDDTGNNIYISDKIQNSVYKINIQKNLNNTISLNLQLFTGGFGGLKDNNNFNIPTQITFKSKNLYVVDYNNYGVKVFNQDLNWLHTYYVDDFLINRPISVEALSNGLVYVLTENYTVYIFDGFSNNIFEKIDINESRDESNLIQIITDENENFINILTQKYLYKYTLAGVYVTTYSIPKEDEINYTRIRRGINNTFLLTSPKCIYKIQDILNVFKLGDGLPYNYWSLDQLKVDKNEFVSDLNYNRCLTRMAQNIISFRDTLNSKFVIATENKNNNVVKYFTYVPVSEKPELNDDISNLDIGVGVNELHLPIVFNRELKKLYYGLIQLADFLSIKNYIVSNENCYESFCWSWDATSCYQLKLPLLKTCDVNPISFQEIEVSVVNENMAYAPTTTWQKAISKCCEKR